MCFSPTASFLASSGLAIIGIATLKKVRAPNEMALASVPLFFAAQQFIEGIIWLGLLQGEAGAVQYWLVQIYSIFVGILWPVFIPLSIWLIEPEQKRRDTILAIELIGAGIAVYTAAVILNFGVSAEIVNRCIVYDNAAPQSEYMVLVYVIATCAAFFISSQSNLRWLGMVNISMFLVAYYLYRTNLVSVWCFFAAAVSGLIYGYFTQGSSQLLAAKTLHEFFYLRRK